MEYFKENIVNELTKMLDLEFGNRVTSFLYFGTRAFDLNLTEYSDYDFVCVLNSYQPGDALKLRGIVNNSYFEGVELDLSFIYLNDIEARNRSNFQLRSVGKSLYEYLQRAQLLLGTNIFADNPIKQNIEDVKKEFDFKIQEWHGRCDKLFLQKLTNQELYKQLSKYTRDIIKFLLLRENIINTVDMTQLSPYDIFSICKKNHLFTKDVENSFQELLGEYKGEESIENVNSIRRKVYEKYLEVFNQDL